MHESMAPGSDEYLDAFMHGFEFVLLAIRGRLAEEQLGDVERAKLEAFLADYSRFVRAYRERTLAKPEDPVTSSTLFKADVTALLVN